MEIVVETEVEVEGEAMTEEEEEFLLRLKKVMMNHSPEISLR